MTDKVPPHRQRRLLRVFLIAAAVFAFAWVAGITTEVIDGRTKLKEHPIPSKQTSASGNQPPLQARG